MDQDDIVLAPWGTVRDKVNAATGVARPTDANAVDQILVEVRSEKETPNAVRQIKALLRKRHNIRPNQPDGFTIRDPGELAKTLGR